jgi:cytochrome P450
MTPTVVRTPKAHALFGHARELHSDPLGFLTMLARDYGPVVPLRFGPFPMLFVSEPSVIDEVLVQRARSFSKALTLRRLRPVLGYGLLTNEGDAWRRQRRLIQPMFHHQRVAGYGEIMVDAACHAMQQWRSGEIRDMHDEMMQLTLNIVTRCLLGSEAEAYSAEFSAALGAAMDAAEARLNSVLILLPDSVPNPQVRRLRQASDRLHQLLTGIISTRRGTDSEREDLLSLLLNARDATDGTRMHQQQVMDELMTLVLAGHETSAILLTWAWYLLANHPEVEAKLHAEVDRILSGRAPCIDDIAELSYTRMFVLETLRLYSPSWIIERQAIEPVEIAGRRLARGTSIMTSQWVVHRDERWFERPHDFDPDRWVDGLEQRLPRFAYFPFGGGPRMCLGSGFAMQEAILLMAAISQRYQLRLVPGQRIEPWPTVTLRPRSGVLMELEERSN